MFGPRGGQQGHAGSEAKHERGDHDDPKKRWPALGHEAGEQHEAQHDGETGVEDEGALPGIRRRKEGDHQQHHGTGGGTGHPAPSQQHAYDGNRDRQRRGHLVQRPVIVDEGGEELQQLLAEGLIIGVATELLQRRNRVKHAGARRRSAAGWSLGSG